VKKSLAAGLLIVTFAGLAVAWSLDRWALAVSQVGILALALPWAAYLMMGRAALPSRVVLPVTGFVLWGGAQLTFGWSVYPWQTSEAILYWLTNLAAVAMASSLARDVGLATRLRTWVFVAGCVLAFIAVTQNFTSDGRAFWIFRTPYPDHVYGPFLYKNQYAAFIELLLPIAWAGALSGGTRRWTFLVVTGALIACVVASESRAGLIVATMELLVVPAILLCRGMVSVSHIGKTLAPLCLIGVIFILVVGPETAWARLQERDPYSTRRDMTIASVSMVQERPFRGFGLGTWPSVYPHYAAEDDGLFANQAHDDWAQAAAEGGLPGFACFAALFLWAVRTAGRRAWALGLAGVLLHALVDYPIQRQAIGVFFFLLAGIASGTKEEPGAIVHHL
jgi:O-antigen ligase